MPTEWEPERLTRLRREKTGLEAKRDEHRAQVAEYDDRIRRVDMRIRDELAHMSGKDATGDG